MEIPVAGVEDVRDREPVPFGDPGHLPHDVHELRTRHDAVEDVVVRRQAPERWNRALPAFPEQFPFFLARSEAHFFRATFQALCTDARGLRLDHVVQPVQFDEEVLLIMRSAGDVAFLTDDNQVMFMMDRGMLTGFAAA